MAAPNWGKKEGKASEHECTYFLSLVRVYHDALGTSTQQLAKILLFSESAIIGARLGHVFSADYSHKAVLPLHPLCRRLSTARQVGVGRVRWGEVGLR